MNVPISHYLTITIIALGVAVLGLYGCSVLQNNQKPTGFSWRSIDMEELECVPRALSDTPVYVFTEAEQIRYVFRHAPAAPGKPDYCAESAYEDLLRHIDFSKMDVLGFRWGASGCKQKLTRSVKNDVENNQIVFRLNIEEEGRCEPLAKGTDWVIVPNIPSGYSVKFIRDRFEDAVTEVTPPYPAALKTIK